MQAISVKTMATWRRGNQATGKPRSFGVAEWLVEEIERDLERDVERRQLLRAQAADIVRRGGLGQVREAVAMDCAHMLQAFRLADGYLGPQAVSA